MRLETERLILRPLEESDAPALHPLINDADVAANMLNLPHPYPERNLVPWIRQAREAMERKERYELAIVLKETGLLVGVCAFCVISWSNMKAELGYWMGKPYWGHGYTTEAVRALVDYGFREFEFERIYAGCFERNLGSVRVLEKAGLKLEGKSVHDIKKGDEFLDVLQFGLVRADYLAG